MKKMKKILAFVMAMAMVLGMSVTSFATGNGKSTNSTDITGNGIPSSSDKATVMIKDLNENAIITAYRIVESDYYTEEETTATGKVGFKEYKLAQELTTTDIANYLAPTFDEVKALAITESKLTGLTKVESGKWTKGTVTDGKADFTASLTAGYWLVLIKGTVGDVYNPMLLGVYYSTKDGTKNTLEGGILKSTDEWELTAADGSKTTYPKREEANINKQIVGTNAKDQGGNTVPNGSSAGVRPNNGNIVNFQIDTVIPSYPTEDYEKVTVKVTDTLSEGLTYTENSLKVWIDGHEVTAEENASSAIYKFIKTDPTDTVKTTGLDITFSQKNTGIAKEVKITYSATVNEKAAYNFDPNTNTAVLAYTNNPNSDSEADRTTKDSKTYTYTFALGATLTKNEEISGWEETTEIVKVDENGNLIVVDSQSQQHPGQNVTKVAEGATFTLYTGEEKQDETTRVTEATTDVNGKLTFTGLNVGTYTLKETKAPTGFQLDSTSTHKVVISAVYNGDGTLHSYKIEIDNKPAKEYTATYVQNADTLQSISGNNNPTAIIQIPNTKLSSLPSTGGIGTTIFTIGGCAIMIVAAGLFFASRRKSSK